MFASFASVLFLVWLAVLPVFLLVWLGGWLLSVVSSLRFRWLSGSWRALWASGLGWRLLPGWSLPRGRFAVRLSWLRFFWVPASALVPFPLPFWRWCALRALWLLWRGFSFPARRVVFALLAFAVRRGLLSRFPGAVR